VPSFKIFLGLFSWDIERAIEDHLRPLLSDLENVVSFNIKSQVLYLTELSLAPRQQVSPFLRRNYSWDFH
jgi:hypothetical protein